MAPDDLVNSGSGGGGVCNASQLDGLALTPLLSWDWQKCLFVIGGESKIAQQTSKANPSEEAGGGGNNHVGKFHLYPQSGNGWGSSRKSEYIHVSFVGHVTNK